MLTFLFIKSINLILNGARGIVLASILGPGDYGVFGTLVVLQQFLSYAALGMREGVTIKLARSAGAPAEVRVIYSSALAWGACSGLLSLAALVGLHSVWELSAKHLFWVALISCLSIVNEILVNINRYENKLRKVAAIEFVYYATALLVVVAFRNEMTVSRALQATFVGVLIAVAGYLATVRGVSMRAASWHAIKELIGIGLLPAIFSAVLVLMTLFYVLAANWMSLGKTIGLIVFGNNISTMILFGLNTVSWALSTRSMNRLYISSSTNSVSVQTDLSDVFFRFGVIAAVLLAVGTQFVFAWAMKEYEGSAIYVLHLCLFQSYGLLLFNEINFLSVNSRLKPIIIGYLVIAALLATVCLLGGTEFLQLVQLGVLAYFVLALWIAFYCRRRGFSGGSFTHRVASLSFPVICTLAHSTAGVFGVVCVCLVSLAVLSFLYGERAVASVTGRSLW